MRRKVHFGLEAALALVWLGAAGAQQPDSPSLSRVLSGTVRLSEGQLPDQRVRVSLFLPNGAPADEVFSDSNGSFEFTRVRPGIYRLVVRARGYQPVSVEVEMLPFHTRTVMPPIFLHTPSAEAGDTSPTGIVAAVDFQISKAARENLEKGRRLAEQGRHTQARTHFFRALELYPEFFQAHYGLGVSLTLLGELPEARKALERAIELNPRAPEPYLALGKVLNLMNEPQEAKAVVLKGTHLTPSAAAMWVQLSRAELSLGEFNEAVQHATQALELDAEAPPEVHLILANAYLKLRRYPDAEHALSAFLKADPRSSSAPKAREVLDQLHRAGVRPPKK